MSNEVLYPYAMPDSSVLFNKHFTNILKPGVYTGLEVLSRSYSRSLKINPGCFLDKYGRNLVFNDSIMTQPLSSSDLDLDRIDSVCIYCPGQAVNGATQDPVIVIKKGQLSLSPVPPFIAEEDYFVIANVLIRHSAAYINQTDISMVNRPTESSEYNQAVTEASIHSICGNRKTFGLNLSCSQDKLTVSPGHCVIGGRSQLLLDAAVFDVPDVTSIIADVQGQANIATAVATFQPTFPVQLKILLALSAPTNTGIVTISGKDQNGEVISEAASISINESTPLMRCLTSSTYFSSVSTISLTNFDTNINKTGVQVRAINNFYVVASKHEHYAYMPVAITTIPPSDPAISMVLGQFSIACNGSSRVVTISSGNELKIPVIAKTVRLPEGNFAGGSGTIISHNLGLDPEKYSVLINPKPENAIDAAKIGTVWFDQLKNSVRVRNTGSSTCSFSITLILEE